MSNQAYNRLRDDLLNGTRQMASDAIRCVAVTSAYTHDPAHTSLADIPGGSRVATLGSNLTGASVSNGIFTVSNFTFPSVPAGSTIVAFIFYVFNAVEANADLIAHVDTESDGVTPISLATDGNNVNCTLGANGVVQVTNPTIP